MHVFRNASFLFDSESFLQFKGHAPPPRLASVLMFLSELLRRNVDSDPALLTLPLPSLLRCVMLVNELQGKSSFSTQCLTAFQIVCVLWPTLLNVAQTGLQNILILQSRSRATKLNAKKKSF